MPWYIWLVLGIVLCTAEIFIPGFVILWFGISAIFVAFLALIGLNKIFQWIIFIISSFVLILLTRRLAEKLTKTRDEHVGPESLIGKEAIVIEEIDPIEGKYLVKVNGTEWVGRVLSKKPSKGERLHIREVRGNTLILE